MFSKFLFKRKIVNLRYTSISKCWSEDHLLHNHDIIHYAKDRINRKIVSCDLLKKEYIDIRTINGITSTNTDIDKSKLKVLDQLTSDKKKLPYKTDKDFCTNTKWLENRFKVWTCFYQSWDRKKFLCTPDGSHHTAAVYMQAKEQNRSFELKCELYSEQINFKLLAELFQLYDYFYMNQDEIYQLNTIVRHDKFCKQDSPFLYPINPPILGIKKSISGNIIISHLKNHKCISILSEVDKELRKCGIDLMKTIKRI